VAECMWSQRHGSAPTPKLVWANGYLPEGLSSQPAVPSSLRPYPQDRTPSRWGQVLVRRDWPVARGMRVLRQDIEPEHRPE
jgi:hypothetical protein